jgi:NADH:ubiquinone oxidoreductase subunit 6 (subunit J)
VLPRVENPIPETIGLGTIISIAGALGVASVFLATILGLPNSQKERWGMWGTTMGFLAGLAFYMIALLAQLLCRQ